MAQWNKLQTRSRWAVKPRVMKFFFVRIPLNAVKTYISPQFTACTAKICKKNAVKITYFHLISPPFFTKIHHQTWNLVGCFEEEVLEVSFFITYVFYGAIMSFKPFLFRSFFSKFFTTKHIFPQESRLNDVCFVTIFDLEYFSLLKYTIPNNLIGACLNL